jgi:hypothetical protein
MPKPRKGEKRNKFMSRCISDTVGEGKDQKQAIAICFSLWTENADAEMASEDYFRVSVNKEKKGARLKPIVISRDIKAIYDVTNQRIQAYLFDKEKYDNKTAKEWVKEHNEWYEWVAKVVEETYPKVIGERSDD